MISKATSDAIEAIPPKLKGHITQSRWRHVAPLVWRIQQLKQQRSAVVLAHNYMAPEIFHGVADVTGDSLALAREAAKVEADVILMAGVHFMAETAKLLNPDKMVLIPDLEAGCSLASSITAQDVRELKRQRPGVPVVTYVNTSAAVKAESDVCCTSGNAVEVVRSLGVPQVIFLPDRYLGRWVAAESGVDLILWKGACEVHEQFDEQGIVALREKHKGLTVVAHPECPDDVLDEADCVGSTSQMIDFVRRERPARVALITECSMASNVSVEFPEVEFIQPCRFCPHMKRITLSNMVRALERLEHQVTVDERVALRARRAVERMVAVQGSVAA